ncbi:MAG: twin-arginine translocation signal domain-containing protein [Spirochaetales bacterium]|nr:twin-arginine translocation signal domain-containing protein [Spirochaetales bacterium]
MSKITRRKFLKYMAVIGGTGASLSLLDGCCHLFNICDKSEEWKKNAANFWANRWRERKNQRKKEREAGKRPDVETPYPYLHCDIRNSSKGHLANQFREIPLNQWRDVYFTVNNQGNAASWMCYVEMYETPFASYHLEYSQLRLVSRKIISVLPGQHKEVIMPWQSTRLTNGGMVARCYDPLFDPGALTFEQYYRQSNGFSWSEWIGG